MSTRLPVVRLLRGEDRRLRRGHPWGFANELDLDAAARALEPGSAVTLAATDGNPLGSATFNLHSLIAARLYASQPGIALDASFFSERLAAAEALRARFYERPYYRLVHAEGDGLPGLVVDRFGDTFVVQSNTAGMERALPALLEALELRFHPRAVVLRNDSPVRRLEGLDSEVRVAVGDVSGPIEVLEGDARFQADLLGGQKTGWFYDLADARARVARLSRDSDVLDLYCHTGGFGILAALAGAKSVLAIDSSEAALDLAATSARTNNVGAVCAFRRGDVFEELARAEREAVTFDVVVADPPSFVKSRREAGAGLRGYRKLAARCATLLRPGGFLFIASCSHHVERGPFVQAVADGLVSVRRGARIVADGGAGADHPIHPALPESAYMKHLTLQLD